MTENFHRIVVRSDRLPHFQDKIDMLTNKIKSPGGESRNLTGYFRL